MNFEIKRNTRGILLHKHEGIVGWHKATNRHYSLAARHPIENTEVQPSRWEFSRQRRDAELERVRYDLDKLVSYKDFAAFARTYDWRDLVLSGWNRVPERRLRKYWPGEIVFDVEDDSKGYIFIGSMSRPGTSAYWVIDPRERRLVCLTNIQYASENRGTTRGNPFRRMIQQKAIEGM